MTRRAVVAGWIGLCFFLFAYTIPAALAQTGRSGSSAPSATLQLASKTPWVGKGGELVIRIAAEGSVASDAELAVTVYNRVTSRSQFVQTLDGRLRGSTLNVSAAPLASLVPDAAGAVTVRLGVQDPDLIRDTNRLFLAREGVYPVRVELRDPGGGRATAGFTTHLIYVPEPPEGDRLGFAWVLPIHAAPTGTGDQRQLPTEATERLRILADALAGFASLDLTLRPTPQALEVLADNDSTATTDLLQALASGIRGRQILSETYVPTDPRAFLAAGLRDELTAQRARGAEVLDEVLDVRADPRTWLMDRGLDTELLALARDSQVDRLIVGEGSLEPIEQTVTLARPFLLGGDNEERPLQALAADSGLARHFGADNDQVRAAHGLLADLAVIHFDSPATSRAVVVVPPRSWQPTSSFLDVAFAGLTQSPIVSVISADRAFEVDPAESSRGRPLVREPADVRRPAPLPGSAIRQTRRDVTSFGTLVEPGNAFEIALDRDLLATQLVGLSESRRQDQLEAINESIQAELTKIGLPQNRSVTLTARGGEIPVTIQTDLDYSLRARLRVESDKLTFPSGNERDLELSRQNTTERFEVQVRTSGAFPLRVVLESPDGRLILGQSLFTVRSRAASGVGVALSVGAGGFLLIWWIRHIFQARREE